MKKKRKISKKAVTPRENFSRVENVLSSDKLPISGDCKNVALKDIRTVLNEYFDVEDLNMDINGEDRAFKVSITFTALRVKTFNVLK